MKEPEQDGEGPGVKRTDILPSLTLQSELRGVPGESRITGTGIRVLPVCLHFSVGTGTEDPVLLLRPDPRVRE